MLADSAQVHGGKLFVLGGGFDTIRTRSVPAVHKALAVVMVAEISPGERETNLQIEVTLMDEDMQSLGPRASGTLRVGDAAQLFELGYDCESGMLFNPTRRVGLRPRAAISVNV